MVKASNPAPKKQPAAAAPHATPESSSDLAPETMQEHAGASQTQDDAVLSGANGPDPVIGLRITAKREGFRRAGQPWSVRPTEIPLVGLTDDQVKALMDEHGHMLTVEEITLP